MTHRARGSSRAPVTIRFYEEGLAVNGLGLVVIESVSCIRGRRVAE